MLTEDASPHIPWGEKTLQQRLRSIGLRFASGFLIALVVVSILMAVWAGYEVCCNFPPVSIASLDGAQHPPVCPGESYDFHSVISIESPTVLFFYLSVMNARGEYNLNGTQQTLPQRPHPRPATFTQTLPWLVPDLPPGSYRRVLAVRGADTRERPVFIETMFTVRENCPKIIPEEEEE